MSEDARKKKDMEVPSILAGFPPEITMVILRVLELEHSKLYLDRPHVIDDIVRIVKEEVQ